MLIMRSKYLHIYCKLAKFDQFQKVEWIQLKMLIHQKFQLLFIFCCHLLQQLGHLRLSTLEHLNTLFES